MSLKESLASMTGGSLTLRPGDVVKVYGNIGVIANTSIQTSGKSQQWNTLSPKIMDQCHISYTIEFRPGVNLRHAWWQIEEIDEIVSLGPFHENTIMIFPSRIAKNDLVGEILESMCHRPTSSGSDELKESLMQSDWYQRRFSKVDRKGADHAVE